MIDPLFAIVCFVSSGSTVPDWVVTGPDAEIGLDQNVLEIIEGRGLKLLLGEDAGDALGQFR